MNNYKLTIQYDGTRYSGWQKQGNTADTIQGKIETVLQKWLKEDTYTTPLLKWETDVWGEVPADFGRK